MRYLIPPFLALLLPLSVTAHAAPSAESAARLAESGAPRLALSIAARTQPESAGRRQWLEWEALRLDLLRRLEQAPELLQRVQTLPADASAELKQQAGRHGAWAAVKLGKGELARDYLAQTLWRVEIPEKNLLDARRLVIQSYLAEHKPEEAYLAMLRYQQDAQPLDKADAAWFSQALAASGKAAEAIPWFFLLDDQSLRLAIRLKAGLIGPEAAIVSARAALQRSGGPGYWAVLALAAEMAKDSPLRVDALEHLLNEAEPPAGELFAVSADQLWQSYFAAALAAGNERQLLLGEDKAWFDLAAQVEPVSPQSARALFAYLSIHAGEAEIREAAQFRLASLLLQQKLRITANRLFASGPAGADYFGLAPQARTLLGEAAFQAGEIALAARLWRGAATPQGVPAEEWQLRLAQVFAFAGASQDAFAAAKKVLDTKPVPSETTSGLLGVARELAASGEENLAWQLLLAMESSGLAESGHEVYFEQGLVAEKRKDYPAAAERFLQAAELAESRDGAFGQQAREFAATNLARAGFVADAKAQYRSLLQAAREPARQQQLKRALDKLGP